MSDAGRRFPVVPLALGLVAVLGLGLWLTLGRKGANDRTGGAAAELDIQEPPREPDQETADGNGKKSLPEGVGFAAKEYVPPPPDLPKIAGLPDITVGSYTLSPEDQKVWFDRMVHIGAAGLRRCAAQVKGQAPRGTLTFDVEFSEKTGKVERLEWGGAANIAGDIRYARCIKAVGEAWRLKPTANNGVVKASGLFELK